MDKTQLGQNNSRLWFHLVPAVVVATVQLRDAMEQNRIQDRGCFTLHTTTNLYIYIYTPARVCIYISRIRSCVRSRRLL